MNIMSQSLLCYSLVKSKPTKHSNLKKNKKNIFEQQQQQQNNFPCCLKWRGKKSETRMIPGILKQDP